MSRSWAGGSGRVAANSSPAIIHTRPTLDSLRNRIVPRHRFLQHVRGDPGVPFPLGHLKCCDKQFATEVASATLAEYMEFREQLLAQASDASGGSTTADGAARLTAGNRA